MIEVTRRKVVPLGGERSLEGIMNNMLRAYYSGITNISEEDSSIINELFDLGKSREKKEIVNKNDSIDKKSNASNKISDDIRKKLEEARAKLKEIVIGNKVVLLHPDIAERVLKANEEMKRETGKEINITSHYRTYEEQERIWRNSWEGEPYKSRRKYRAAPPGVSNHNYGLAIDVANWKQAEPYLRKYGLRNDIADDRVHFSLNGR